MVPVSLRRVVLLECSVKVGVGLLCLIREVVRRVRYGVTNSLAVLISLIPRTLLPNDRLELGRGLACLGRHHVIQYSSLPHLFSHLLCQAALHGTVDLLQVPKSSSTIYH